MAVAIAAGSATGYSGLPEQVMAQHVIEPMPPKLIGVASNIDAFDELQFAICRVLNVKIDVEDQIAHLLHSSPGRPVGADDRGVTTLAPVASADLRTVGDPPLHLGRDWHDLVATGIVEPFPQQVIEQFDRPASLGVDGSNDVLIS